MSTDTVGYSIARRLRGGNTPAPDLGIEPPEWTLLANCLSVDPQMFHADKGGSVRQAKSVCRGCDARAECLIFAMLAEPADYLRFGVYGGLGPVERRTLAKSGWLPGDPTPDVIDARRPLVQCPHCGLSFRYLPGHVVMHRDRSEAVA